MFSGFVGVCMRILGVLGRREYFHPMCMGFGPFGAFLCCLRGGRNVPFCTFC